MLQAIEGVYKNGLIHLSEMPEGVSESRVIVTFLREQPIQRSPRLIQRGMFSGEVKTSEEDFQLAEFHGDADDGLDWS